MNHLYKAELLDSFTTLSKENYNNNLARKKFNYTVSYNTYYSDIERFISENPIFNNIIVLQLDKTAENGYPHTRPDNIICIPNDARLPDLEVTLYHEYIHIHQRRNKDLWKTFLNNEGWNEVSKNSIPERWKDRVRLNPDTIYSQFWSFHNYVPLPIFENLNNPKFDEIKIMYYDLTTGILEHDAPSIFINKYGTNRQSEHPFEIYAVMLEKKIKNDNDILSFIRV
jgi:hypothetical protein